MDIAHKYETGDKTQRTKRHRILGKIMKFAVQNTFLSPKHCNVVQPMINISTPSISGIGAHSLVIGLVRTYHH